MSDYKISEGRFKGFQNIDLYFQVWKTPNPRGTMIITHGHGEHTDCYQRVVDGLQGTGWDIYAWDMRGHGKSEGIRGYSASFDYFCEDFKIFLDHVKGQPAVKDRALVMFAHSLGCLVQLKTLVMNLELQPDSMVLGSPFLGFGMKVPTIKKVGAEWLVKLLPQVTLWNEVRSVDLTRDPEVIREFEQDPFRHDRISSGVYLGSLDSFPVVQNGASTLSCRTLLQASNKDPVVSSPEAMRFFENLGSADKILKIYDNAKHELYNDICREQALQDLREFLAGVQKTGASA